MESIKFKQNDKFKARVKQILHPESNTSSSGDDCNVESPDKRPPVTAPVTDDSEAAALRLLHKHEEFIAKQLNAVRKMQQKGILTVSSKQSTDDRENDETNDVVKEEQLEASGEGSSSRG